MISPRLFCQIYFHCFSQMMHTTKICVPVWENQSQGQNVNLLNFSIIFSRSNVKDLIFHHFFEKQELRKKHLNIGLRPAHTRSINKSMHGVYQIKI